MNLFTVGKGFNPASSNKKYDPIPSPIKTTMKYKAPKAIKIFKAKLVENEADLIKALHSKSRNCFIMSTS